MAYTMEKASLPAIASSNVTTITWTGNPPTYSSGGIALGQVVSLDASDSVGDLAVTTATATSIPLGVADLDRVAVGPGQPVRVMTMGVARVKAGGAITIGAHVVSNASGLIIAATESQATSQLLVGQALQAAAQSGDLISVQLMIGGTTAVSS